MPLTILYVEDNKLVADTVSDTLTLEGWRVTLCRDGLSALHELQSATHYDLLLLDQGLPHIDGLQLIRHARTLAHRQHTPIIMLSANQCRDEARRVGADIFLQKPEGINHLVLTIMQLLHQGA
ncbi:MAG: hypothetical protein DMF64_20805 [Acidobacteria bacterium]|nr:MAG: hypothetical protein DMF64_20805 [Acidobacteriota bacterium]